MQNSRQFYLICFLCGLCISCANTKNVKNTADYLPNWITHTYAYELQPVFVALVHNLPYDNSRQIQNAKEQIARQVLLYEKVFFKFQYISSEDYLKAENEFENQYFEYSYDVTRINEVAEQVKILEFFDASDMHNGTYYLGCYEDLPIPQYFIPETTTKLIPHWIRWEFEPSIINNFVVGVAKYPLYSRQPLEKLLEAADHLSFMRLVTQFEIKSRSAYIEQLNERYDIVKDFLDQRILLMLQNVSIIGRWIDIEKKEIYSLSIAPDKFTVLEGRN